MSSARGNRSSVISALDREIRLVSAQSVLHSEAVADRIGLHPTDLECLDLLVLNGPLTPKQLAEFTGLTSGAITGVIDRLERAGYVRREPNPKDRRSLIVEPQVETVMRAITPLYAPLQQSMDDVFARYSDDELAVVLDFIQRSNAAVREQIARLRAGDPRAGSPTSTGPTSADRSTPSARRPSPRRKFERPASG